MIDNEKALSDLLIDIDSLQPLSEWTDRFNIFDVLKITKAEIRHSNVLSWLLDPSENHQLGDKAIKGIVQYGVEVSEKLHPNLFELLLMDYHDIVVKREWRNIDILAYSENEQFVLCIENKVLSGEGKNQLERYKDIVDRTYPTYKKLFLYLTPEGIDSSDQENWISISYQEIIDILEEAKHKTNISTDVDLFIENYLEAVRRNIVGDEKLEKLCREIYLKHKQALDLIYEYKPDKASDIAELFREWAIDKTKEGTIKVDLEALSKCGISFLK